jgi:rhodanese-related sulfurtransferase
MESTCYLLKDENGKDFAIFTGDTLFIGDVGRPDLAVKSHLTKEDLAAHLYNSLHNKIMPLADDVIVYPAHGAGSACGKNMSKETFDTLGHQKQVNYALKAATKEIFIKEVTEGLLPPPFYFPKNVMLKKQGYETLETLMKLGLHEFTAAEFEVAAEETHAIIIDTRQAQTFKDGFVPRSINIGLKGDFAPWVGALIGDVKQEIVLVTDQGMEEEVITRLSRVGFDHVLGFLEGGFDAWKNAGKEVDTVHRISATEFEQEFNAENSSVIDVRKESEYAAEHIDNAYCKPLADINVWTKDIQPNEHFFLHCAGGYRSMIAASILQARGYRNFTEIEGGFNAIAKTSIPTSDFVCQSKLLN